MVDLEFKQNNVENNIIKEHNCMPKHFHVLLRDLYTSVHAPLDVWTRMIQLESIDHDYIMILKSQYHKQISFQVSVEIRVLYLEN